MTYLPAFLRFGALVVLGFILCGSPAPAQPLITQEQSFSNASGTSPISFSFNTFDTSTGNTLDYVEVSLTDLTFSGSAQGINEGSVNEAIYVNLEDGLAVTAPSGINNSFSIMDSKDYGELDVAPGATAGPFSYTQNPANITSGFPNKTLSSMSSDLSPYTTADGESVTVTVTPSGIVVSGYGVNSSDGTMGTAPLVSGSGSIDGNVSLIYTYATPVPEPSESAAWMIGFSLCILGGRTFLKRRGFRVP